MRSTRGWGSLKGIEELGPEGVGRAFVALPCPPGLRKALAETSPAWRQIDADVRWVDPSIAHLTLRFLGRADRTTLGALDRSIRMIASESAPIELTAGEPGAFPGWRRPRILWLGLEEGGALARIAGALEHAAREAGFPPEERMFQAHMTLGRVRSPRGAERATAAVQSWRADTGPETVSEIVLYRSDPGPKGPRYTPLETYALTGRRTT